MYKTPDFDLTRVQQVLYGIIQDIASQFQAQDQVRYKKAAATFRIPYWDWAAQPGDGFYFPNSVGGSTTVSVITPTSKGQPVVIANPLYSTKFHPLNPVAGDFVSVAGAPVSLIRSPFDLPVYTSRVALLTF